VCALQAIGELDNLAELNLGNNDMQASNFVYFSKLKKLHKICLPYFDAPDLAKLRAILPRTVIVIERRPSFRM